MDAARVVFIAGVSVLLSACNTLSAQEHVPAVITEPTPQSREELLRVVTAALNGASVSIADDALTRTSLLIIERRAPRDLQGRPLTGRELGTPERFQLMTNGSRCVLVHQPDGERSELTETTCVPEQR